MMQATQRLLIAATAVIALSACSPDEPSLGQPPEQPLLAADQFSGPAVATVNGQPIPEDLLLAYLRMRGQVNADPARRQAAIRELIDLYLLAEEARRSGLLDRASIKALIEVQKLTLVANQAVTEFAQGDPVTDAEVQAEYETTLGHTGEQEYRVRHILTEDQQAAEQIIGRLEQGEDFEAIERAHAEEHGVSSAGELGWVNLAQVPPAFGEAVKALEPGSHTTVPVQSEYGWHVILLDESRDLQPPPLEEVSAGIRTNLGRQRIEEHLSELREQAEIDISD